MNSCSAKYGIEVSGCSMAETKSVAGLGEELDGALDKLAGILISMSATARHIEEVIFGPPVPDAMPCNKEKCEAEAIGIKEKMMRKLEYLIHTAYQSNECLNEIAKRL